MTIPKITIFIPKLELAADYGGQNQIGFKRTDLPLFHTIARAPGGSVFTLDGHFDHCPVCKEHGVTLKHFDEFMDRKRGA